MVVLEGGLRMRKEKSANNEIFASNIVANAWFQNNLDSWILSSGDVQIINEKDQHCLSFDAEESCQVKQSLSIIEGHKYYVSFNLDVTRADKGRFGIQLYGPFEEGSSIFIGTSEPTIHKQFFSEIITAKKSTNEINLFVGSLYSASGSGKLSQLLIIDLTELCGKAKEPKLSEFERLKLHYDSFGMHIKMKDIFQIMLNSDNLPERKIVCTDDQAEAFFIDEMNRKCQILGMSNSKFVNSHGLEVSGQYSCSRDILLLTLHASGYNELLRVWGEKEYDVHFKGKNERTVRIETTVKHEVFSSHYSILGGKTGILITGGDAYNVACLFSNGQGKTMIGVTMGAVGEDGKNKRFLALKQLADFALEKRDNPDTRTIERFDSHAGSILFLPEGSPWMYTHSHLPSYCSINENDPIRPASLTKILTTLILLDHVKDLNESFVIKQSDLVGGTGPIMYEGDQLTYYDALYLMMLPSSSKIAKAIARIIGRKIADKRTNHKG